MNTVNRIPACSDFSYSGMRQWFQALSRKDLLFHPDDDPASVLAISNGARLFSRNEVSILRRVLRTMFARNGDAVYDAAYPVFMDRMKIRRRS